MFYHQLVNPLWRRYLFQAITIRFMYRFRKNGHLERFISLIIPFNNLGTVPNRLYSGFSKSLRQIYAHFTLKQGYVIVTCI